jgi:predicted ATPase
VGPPVFERESATAAIDAVLREVALGHGRTLFIVGEAGLGKTTMLDRAQALAGAQFVTGVGHGDAAEATLPFGVFSQALDDLGTGGRLDVDANAVISGTDARAARFYTVLRFLEQRRAEPVLLLLDDLHWADSDSLGLVSFLCRRIGGLPVGIIATLRPWPPSALETAQRLAGRGEAQIERLSPLSESASLALLSTRAGASISEEQILRARTLTSGNPLLLEQVALEIARGKSVPEPTTASFQTELLRARFAGGTAS